MYIDIGIEDNYIYKLKEQKNNKDNIKISVIVPVYNSEKYIERCINSIISQKLDEIEIIFINDNSKDNSINILKEYENKYPNKIIVINSNKNRGAGGARNVGLLIASGEYIGFVDSDDYITEDMYYKLYKIAKRGNYDMVDSAFFSEKTNEKIVTLNNSVIGKLDNEKRKLLSIYMGYIVTKIIKRDIIIKNNITFRENTNYEDTDFLFILSLYLEKVTMTNSLFYTYCYNKQSLTNKFSLKRFIYDKIETIEHIVNIFKKLNEFENYKDEIALRTYIMYEGILTDVITRAEVSDTIFEYAYKWFKSYGFDYNNNKYISAYKKDRPEKYNNLVEFNQNNRSTLIKLKHENEHQNNDKNYKSENNKIPKISIIVPVYNSEKYLKQCINSIINQKLEDIEIIAINDASTDDSINILNSYKNKYPNKIKVINLSKNKGAGGARNEGIHAATGEYIGFVDSDDYIQPEMYYNLYKIAKRANYDMVDSGLNILETGEILNVTPDEAVGKLTKEKREILLMYIGYIMTKIIKRDIITENNIYFREKVSFEDVDFIHILYMHIKSVGKTNAAYYNYRKNNLSQTNTFSEEKCFQEMQAIETTINEFKRLGEYDNYKIPLTLRLYYIYIGLISSILNAKKSVSDNILLYISDKFKELEYDYNNNKFIKQLKEQTPKELIDIAEKNLKNPNEIIKLKNKLKK